MKPSKNAELESLASPAPYEKPRDTATAWRVGPLRPAEPAAGDLFRHRGDVGGPPCEPLGGSLREPVAVAEQPRFGEFGGEARPALGHCTSGAAGAARRTGCKGSGEGVGVGPGLREHAPTEVPDHARRRQAVLDPDRVE